MRSWGGWGLYPYACSCFCGGLDENLSFARQLNLCAVGLIPAKQHDVPAGAGLASTAIDHPVGTGFAHSITGPPTGRVDTILPLWGPWDRRGFQINSQRGTGFRLTQVAKLGICHLKRDNHPGRIIGLKVNRHRCRGCRNAGRAVKGRLTVVMKAPLRVDHPAQNAGGVCGESDPVITP